LHLGWTDEDRRVRLTRAVFMCLAAAAALRVAGVPSVDLHGPLHYLGVMDPFCGGTRAAFLLMSRQFGAAATYNPIVFPLAVGAVVMVVRACVGWISGRWLDLRVSAGARRVLVTLCVVALVALEIRQQLHAPLLMQSWG
jgi:hypothetical protein